MNSSFKIIDLTHTLSPEIPFWSGKSAFELEVKTDYKDCTPPDTFRTNKIKCAAGIGTHIDAPAHVVENGRTSDKLTLEELVVDSVVIDVSGEADEKYIIMPSVVEKFEKEHGQIPPGSLVIFYTGWDKLWGTPKKYHNDYVFPAVHVSTAEMLLKRNIAGIGTDTLSCDTGAEGFPVHRAILGADKYLIENIANAKMLPATGAKIFVLPMKMKDATESPVRLVAFI
ncbi:MAG TPA: cyclase family protein [Candidatus Paceibacterota bacterium]